MKVSELAKELKLKSAELLPKLHAMGIEVKSATSAVSEEAAERVREEIRLAKEKADREASVKTGVRAAKKEPKSAPKAETKAQPVLEVPKGITVKEFADKINHPPAELIKLLLSLGEMVTINQSMSEEAINVVAEEFGYEPRLLGEEQIAEEFLKKEEVVEKPEDLVRRPPVVTVMGHVNHGKTLLLDAIRETDVVSQEAGGITQHIGAYQIAHNGKPITFIDTPGHEAFTAMRARGAKVTDIAVLVVAADDGVMPQTVEAIHHAQAAKVPIIVAVNKIDKAEANPERVKKQLVEQGLVPEEWGGETIFVDVSAKTKTNIDELLEMVQLVADIQDLKANEKAPARGSIIEAQLDKGRGPVATILLDRGVLKVGQVVVAGTSYGKVRAMMDDKGQTLHRTMPAQPVSIFGLSSVPKAGETVEVVSDERLAKDIVGQRVLKMKRAELEERKQITLENLFEQIKEGEVKDLNLIVKADVQGSLEALRESLAKIDQTEVRIAIVHEGVGAIIETDVMLAAASNAIIVGFNVRPDAKARQMADKEQVDMRLYDVIYKVIDDIEAARKGMLAPRIEQVELGRCKVLQIFKISKIGTVAGCRVEDGEVKATAEIRVVRDGVVVHQGKIKSLKRFKEDVASAAAGQECGIHVENFNDVKVDDELEIFETVEKPR